MITTFQQFYKFLSSLLDYNHTQVEVSNTEFQKISIQLDYFIFLSKFAHYGFSSHLIEICQTYLNVRKLFVHCHGYASNQFVALSGVPKIFILHPLSFNLLINDIINELSVYSIINSLLKQSK